MKTPATFGPYRVLDELTSNAEAISLLATPDGEESGVLCLRFLNPTFVKADAEAFAEPMKLAARLNHVNLLQTLDAGIWEEIPYVAMELLAGVSLAQVIEIAGRGRPTLPQDVAVFIASELSAGLAYAHSRRDLRGNALEIAHGDLRPREVLISEKGEIKIANFGSARVLLPALQASGKLMPERYDFLAPEVAAGEAPTAASDIFSICAIAYRLLCGVPVTGPTRDTGAAGKRSPITPIREVDAGVPEELAEILMKGLTLDPAERLDQAREVRTALSGWLRRNSPGFGRHRLKAWLAELDGLRFPSLGEGQTPLQRRDFRIKDGLSVLATGASGDEGARGGIRPWLRFPGEGGRPARPAPPLPGRAAAASAAPAAPPSATATPGRPAPPSPPVPPAPASGDAEAGEVFAARRSFGDEDDGVPSLPDRPAAHPDAVAAAAALHAETPAPDLAAEGVLEGESSAPDPQVPASLEDTPDAPPTGVTIDHGALGLGTQPAPQGGAAAAASSAAGGASTGTAAGVSAGAAVGTGAGTGAASAAGGRAAQAAAGVAAEDATSLTADDYATLVHDDRPTERVEEDVVEFDLTPDPSIRAPSRFSLGRAFLMMVLLGGMGVAAWLVLDLEPPQWALQAEVMPEKGSVWVSSRPPNAEIVVNGTPTGVRTPDVVRELPAGQPLRIGLRMEGWVAPAEQEVQIVDRNRPSLEFSMEPQPHRIRVESDPPGAAVLLHGSAEGETPMTLGPLHVAPGQTLLVTLRLEGYLDELVEARWEAGQEQSAIRAFLRPDPTWEPGN